MTNAATARIASIATPVAIPNIARGARRVGGGLLDNAGSVSVFRGVTGRSAVDGVTRGCEVRAEGGSDELPLGGTDVRLVRPVEMREERSAWRAPS